MSEADLLVQLSECGLVGGLATAPPAAKVLPDAVLAHDEDTGAREDAGGAVAAAEHDVRGFRPRRAGAAGGGARRADEGTVMQPRRCSPLRLRQ